MKGIKKVEDKNGFLITLNIDELKIIKQGLGHLQLNYINLMHDQNETFDWYHTEYKLNELNKLINEFKTLENE